MVLEIPDLLALIYIRSNVFVKIIEDYWQRLILIINYNIDISLFLERRNEKKEDQTFWRRSKDIRRIFITNNGRDRCNHRCPVISVNCLEQKLRRINCPGEVERFFRAKWNTMAESPCTRRNRFISLSLSLFFSTCAGRYRDDSIAVAAAAQRDNEGWKEEERKR